VQIGAVYAVSENCAIPVFNEPKTEFDYETGSHGSDCYELITVLFPGFYVRVNEIVASGTLAVDCTIDGSYTIRGYIHEKLLKRNASLRDGMKFGDLVGHVKPPSVSEISSRLQEILHKKVPYCHGGSSPLEVELDGLYKFHCSANETRGYGTKFTCRGFDTTGLLHYVSNGYLPHSIHDLIDFEMKLFVVGTKSPIATKVVRKILNTLSDTDIVLFMPKTLNRKHSEWTERDVCAMMFYRFGFVESRGRHSGIVRTNSLNAEARLILMFNMARDAGSDLYVIRWHPELLEPMYGSN
jgi:hypothetical protein